MSFPQRPKILFIVPYPKGFAPGQRFRFELFLSEISEQDYQFESAMRLADYKSLYTKRNLVRKIMIVARGLFRRIRLLGRVSQFDLIFLFREAFFFGPPVFEWFLVKVLRKKIIYDFDDAIWLPDPNETNKLWNFLKWKSKVKSICRWSWKVSAGNAYLAEFASQYCDHVEIIPTVVDTEVHRPVGGVRSSEWGDPGMNLGISAGEPDPETNSGITIGWTGSHSTLQYLQPLLPLLKELEDKYDTRFVVIANRDPEFDLRNYQFINWSREREAEDLHEMDIGIMPLTDEEWSRGKCGFKAIQYSAVGIPAIVSPVGVNTEIVLDGKTGFVCATEEEWRKALIQLVESSTLRQEFGEKGREHIEQSYSTKYLKDRFLGLFDN